MDNGIAAASEPAHIIMVLLFQLQLHQRQDTKSIVLQHLQASAIHIILQCPPEMLRLRQQVQCLM